MTEQEPPQRVLLKLSGNAFGERGGAPFAESALDFVAGEIADARESCSQIAVVCGAGNIMRGGSFRPAGPARIRADYAGMLGTVINALVLRDHLEQIGLTVSHYAALPIPRTADIFDLDRVVADLERGAVVLLGGGTGNPLFTTDTAAALRAKEIGADLLLKATRVDGVCSADPELEEDAELYSALSYGQVLERKLGVMDLTAVSFCLEHSLPVRVFNYAVRGNIRRAAAGEAIGTLIGRESDAS